MPPETHFVAVHQIFEALRAIPGCLGVELAHAESGRHSILAWFEDKEALANWYYSDFHKHLQATYFPDETPGPLLAGVPYRGGPIVAVASFGLDEKMDPASPMLSIRDITVDLFSPLSADTLLGTKVDGGSAAEGHPPGGERHPPDGERHPPGGERHPPDGERHPPDGGEQP